MNSGKRCFATCLVMLLSLAHVWPQCVSKAAEVPSLHVAQYVWFQRMVGVTYSETLLLLSQAECNAYKHTPVWSCNAERLHKVVPMLSCTRCSVSVEC